MIVMISHPGRGGSDIHMAGIPAGMRIDNALIPVVSLVPRSTTGYMLSCLWHEHSAEGGLFYGAAVGVDVAVFAFGAGAGFVP